MREEARRMLVGIGAVLTVAMMVGLVLDTWFIGHTESYARVRFALPLQIVTCASGALLLAYWAPAKRHPHLVCCLMGGALMGLVGYSLGFLGGMDGPFFYITYLAPCVGLGLPASLRDRVAFTLCLLLPFLVMFFGFHPSHLGFQYAYIGILHLILVTVVLTYFGDRLQRASRELFVLRSEAQAQSELLSRDNAGLAQEVKLQAESVVAVIDRAESVRAEERRQLARMLHDDMGQLIVSARAGLQNLERTVGSSVDIRDLASLRFIVEDIERSARSVVGALRESDLPFEVAVEDLVEMFRSLGRVEIEIELDMRGWEPPLAVREMCLRVVQESLTNIMKHAEARTARVSVRRELTTLTAVIQDDGRGIPADGGQRGFGLAGMRERVEEQGGTLLVEGAPGGGTRVVAVLPRQSAPPAEAPEVSA
ncbi:MAG: sensor histidine kinase [Polyangiales bacterium]